MTDTRIATRSVLVVGAFADDPTHIPSPTGLVDSIIRPAVHRFGGRLDGSFDERIVASFPSPEAASDAAADISDVASWAAPGVTLDTTIVEDGGGALPSAAAVVAGSRGLQSAGVTVPLAGAGVGAIVLWQPESTVDAVFPAEPETRPPDAGDEPAEITTVSSSGGEEIPEPDLDLDGVLVFARDPGHLDIAVDALERFAEAGLEIPEGLQIYFHGEDSPECQGHANRAFASHGGEVERIDMCRPHDFTLRHEIAHTWAHEHLEDGAVEEFLHMRGLEDWQGNGEWSLNGSEQAAHIIAWGLADQPFRMGEIPDAHDYGDLGDAFALLTGNRPLHDRARPAAAGEDGGFTALDLVSAGEATPENTPPPMPEAPAVTPVATQPIDEPYEAPTVGTALSDEPLDEIDLVDDDADDETEPL